MKDSIRKLSTEKDKARTNEISSGVAKRKQEQELAAGAFTHPANRRREVG